MPSLKDFDRLDPGFRLPEATWNQLPDYGDYGFAVFQLQAGRHQTHPMAFEFPRRDSSQLFFPTVHVHDGHVHPEAGFDHSLYCQVRPRPRGWKAGFWKPYSHPSIWEINEEERAFLNLNGTVYRLRLQGVLDNRDTVLVCR